MTAGTSNNPHRISKSFEDFKVAQTAYNALLEQGLKREQLTLESQTMDVEPPLSQTDAGKNAVPGAIAGALFGIIVCLAWTFIQQGTPEVQAGVVPFPPILASILIISAGSAAGALVSAITGSSTLKPNTNPNTAFCATIEYNIRVVNRR